MLVVNVAKGFGPRAHIRYVLMRTIHLLGLCILMAVCCRFGLVKVLLFGYERLHRSGHFKVVLVEEGYSVTVDDRAIDCSLKKKECAMNHFRTTSYTVDHTEWLGGGA